MRFIDLNEVMYITNRKKTAIYEDIAKKKFPAQVKTGSSSSWVLEEIETWMKEKMDSRTK